ncbi:MAG: NAD-dependent epimerase/dehydratase family protein [Candidatus Omnitrophica bacterium]|nr:NAD-dependent epimerase/dehydratase family protein [Candidatus Omnitrophota bacterium]
MDKSSTILLVGHDDIIEHSLYQYFSRNGFQSVFSVSKMALNATIQPSVYDFFQTHRPEYVILGSTRSGGIIANKEHPADFIYHNLQSECNIFYAANKFKTKKILYLASSCVYPEKCPQPMNENLILTGPLEEISEPYSIAKIAGISLAKSFRKQYGLNTVVMIPATVYGPGSETDLKTAHVMGALIHKFVDAVKNKQSEVVVGGSGQPRREFLYADDFIEAALFMLNQYNDEHVINVGVGEDTSIKELAGLIAELSGFKGTIKYDSTIPDGVQQKLLDNHRMKKTGIKINTELKDGIRKTIDWYKSEVKA